MIRFKYIIIEHNILLDVYEPNIKLSIKSARYKYIICINIYI